MGQATRSATSGTPRVSGGGSAPGAPAPAAPAKGEKKASPRSQAGPGADHFEPARDHQHHPPGPSPGAPPPGTARTGTGSKPGGAGEGNH